MDDFITAYVDYATTLTDAPEQFHYFVGLGVLSTIVNSSVRLPFGAVEIYPNLWIILLAPSSFYRKSTSLSLGQRIIRRVDESLVLPDDFSRERLIENLSVNAKGVFFWNEFASVLKAFQRDYMSGTLEMLTHLYDSPPTYSRTLKGQSFTINDPFINIMSGSTIDWFVKCFREQEIRGGFLPRFLYVSPANKRETLAVPPVRDSNVEYKLVEMLQDIKRISGYADLEAVKKQYADWIIKHESEVAMGSEVGIMSGFWTRIEAYVLKLAILFEISRNRSIQITEDSLNRAIDIVELSKSYIKNLIQEKFVFGRAALQIQKILNLIKENPGIKYGDLLKRSHLYANQLKPTLETLEQSDQIRPEEDGKTKAYYPTC